MKKWVLITLLLMGRSLTPTLVYSLSGKDKEDEAPISADDLNEVLDKKAKEVTAAKKIAAAAPEDSPERQQAQQRAAEGVAAIEGVGRERPDDSRAQHAVGQTLFTVGEYKRVLPFAQREIELKPDKADGYVLAALAHQKMKNNKAANEAAREALKRDPNNKVAFAVKKLTDSTREVVSLRLPPPELRPTAPADNLETSPPPDDGREELNAQANTTADHLEAGRLAKEAENKMKLGDHGAARLLLDKALALEPRSAVKLALRSTLNLKLGDAKAAFKDADAAVAADGKLGLAFAARARAMAALTPDYAPRQVLADYAAAAEADPSYAAEYKRALARYENGGEESQAAAPGGSGADFFDKADLGGSPAQNGFWASLPTQARKKWPQGLVMFGGGFLLLFWLWKKLRQAVPEKPWQDGDPSDN